MMAFIPTASDLKEIIVSLGWTKGMFALFFGFAHWWIYKLYKDRLDDRQREIDKLAKENHSYRDHFWEEVKHNRRNGK